MPHPRLVLIADDLTGALDAAAPFAATARGVEVATGPGAAAAVLGSGADVVAISTRSREIEPGLARDRVAGILASIPKDMQVVKKVDSRLKGNIVAELDAFGDVAFTVLPAIPEFGRFVRDGRLHGFGIPRPIDVAGILGPHARRSAMPDVESRDEMRARVAAAPPGAVLVGARGMTEALARIRDLPPPDIPALPRPICIAVGSTDPITLEQIATLCANAPRLRHVEAPSGNLPPPGPDARDAVTLLQASPLPAAHPEMIAESFARTAAAYVAGAATLIVSGGATAESLLDAVGVTRLRLTGEALPGLPCSRAGRLTIVTKSGGFGDPDALVRLCRAGQAEGD